MLSAAARHEAVVAQAISCGIVRIGHQRVRGVALEPVAVGEVEREDDAARVVLHDAVPMVRHVRLDFDDRQSEHRFEQLPLTLQLRDLEEHIEQRCVSQAHGVSPAVRAGRPGRANRRGSKRSRIGGGSPSTIAAATARPTAIAGGRPWPPNPATTHWVDPDGDRPTTGRPSTV